MSTQRYTEKDFLEKESLFDCCGIFHETINKPMEEHVHDFIEIVYILKGKAVEYINNSMFAVGKGDLLCINYGSKHSFTPLGEMEYVNIGFKLESFTKRINKANAFAFLSLTNFEELRQNDEKLFSFLGKDRIEIERLLEIMLAEASQKRTRSEFVIGSCLDILITILTDKYISHTEEYNIWQEILKFINDNINEKITLDDLAKQCFYNPTYLSRIFKEKFGLNFSQYIKKKRVEKAKELLLNGKTIDYVLEKTGFSSRRILYLFFHEIEGVSISDFRKINHLKEDD